MKELYMQPEVETILLLSGMIVLNNGSDGVQENGGDDFWGD